jgi:hypothetical protein
MVYLVSSYQPSSVSGQLLQLINLNFARFGVFSLTNPGPGFIEVKLVLPMLIVSCFRNIFKKISGVYVAAGCSLRSFSLIISQAKACGYILNA